MRVQPAPELDEEALTGPLSPVERRTRGAYFTPAPLVTQVLSRVERHLTEPPTRIVDPACGAGAFLTACAARFPGSSLLGLELSPESAQRARARLPHARIEAGDALRGGLETLLPPPTSGLELWIGNPPYNGTSTLLRDPPAYVRLRALLPPGFALPSGTSLRDDFAFFLLLAARRLLAQRGVLAFVTSATLLDAFLYGPLRRFLLSHLHLREVLELPPGAFEGTRVRACVTIWASDHAPSGALASEGACFLRCATRAAGFTPGDAQPLTPSAPEWLLRPASPEAAALDQSWRANGVPLSVLIPLSLPGLKTRFDALLTDDDPERLYLRVKAFLECAPSKLEAFAHAHGLPPPLWPKLHALKASVAPDHPVGRDRVRPFFRYAGARHRGSLPKSARAFCYLDRALIPRGDHRLRGGYDPHLGAVKLLFNTRELPLAAALLEEEGCVHAHRHSRFAPLEVPARLLSEGLDATRRGALGPRVPNLSPEGMKLAARLGGPLALFRAVVRFINSPPVQDTWAKSFGATRDLPIPFDLRP